MHLEKAGSASFFSLKMDRYQELLKKKEKAEKKLAEIKPKLSHPHGDAQSTHDQADQDFRVWSAYLEDIEKELRELERSKRTQLGR